MKTRLPILVICLSALAAGIFLAVQQSKQGDTTTASSAGSASGDTQALATMQEALQTSIALPLDFKTIPDFELLDVNAQSVTQSVFEGRWSIIFFGYTHCPDVCPITLQVMKNVASKLVEQNEEPPQVAFVSVDPVRDTSDVMKNYISYFNEEFVGITGELNAVHEMTRSLGIVASFTANDENPDNYIVDHTASLLLVDPQKRVRAKITPPHEADTIIADYLTVVGAPS